MLTLMNFNINGIKDKRGYFQRLLNDYEPDVVCLTETHSDSLDLDLMARGYVVHRKDSTYSNKASGGVAIFIKSNIPHIRLPDQDLEAIQAVTIGLWRSSEVKLQIIGAYRRSVESAETTQRDFYKIFEENFEFTTKLLLGDLNCKHTDWGCEDTNFGGTQLRKIERELNLKVFAPDGYTHYPFNKEHRPDILDIAVGRYISFPINQKLLNTPKKIDSNQYISDHVPVFYELPI